MSSIGAAPCAAVPVSKARAEASRRNGAKSRGPKTPEGKARSSKNALKHGLRAQRYVVLPQEDAAEFAALQAALADELAPEGVLQSILVGRIARAAWRLERAERLEVEVFEERRFADGGPGLALIRDTNGSRTFDTLLRYRGAAMAEFWRALRTLKALQAESRDIEARLTTLPAPPPKPKEPEKARKNNDLDPDKASVAAIPPAGGPSDDAHACPEQCDPSGLLFGSALEFLVAAPPSKAERAQENAPEQ